MKIELTEEEINSILQTYEDLYSESSLEMLQCPGLIVKMRVELYESIINKLSAEKCEI